MWQKLAASAPDVRCCARHGEKRARPSPPIVLGVDGQPDLDAATDAALQLLRADAAALMREVRTGMRDFLDRVGWRWQDAFDAYELVVWASYYLGVRFSRRHRPRATAAQDHRVGALDHLHARGIAIAREVLALLRNGSADAAMARWRTLHETAVVAVFLNANDRDTAERYRLHEVIESHNAALEHERHREALGSEPLAADELSELKAQRDELVARFGKTFATPYGWAAAVLGKDRPTFADVEAAASLDHLRPFYRLASHPLHANPKALTFSLAWDDDSRQRAYAPSNSGFLDPAQSALISLADVTAALLSAVEPAERRYWLPRYRALTALVDDAINLFATTQNELDAEEALVRQRLLPTVEESEPTGIRVRTGTQARRLLRRADEWVVDVLLSNLPRPTPAHPEHPGSRHIS